ncbi:hypothetical protein ACLMNJ_27240 [Streptomyces seoulensis]
MTDSNEHWILRLDPHMVIELIDLWDQLVVLCPNPREAVEHIALRTGMPARSLHETRRTRNGCAHPRRLNGFPPSQLAKAVKTARTALDRLNP